MAFSMEAYFNQNPRKQYTDPYRGITRHGDNLEAVILREIKSAKSTIYLAVQEFRLPQVALALVEKKKAGVDVRVVVEHDYNYIRVLPVPARKKQPIIVSFALSLMSTRTENSKLVSWKPAMPFTSLKKGE